MFEAEKRRFEDDLKHQKAHLNTEKDGQINKLKSDLDDITTKYALLSA